MTDHEFLEWAATSGVPGTTAQQLVEAAASPEEMKEASDAMMPAPPIYTLDDIIEMSDTDCFGFQAKDHGFILIGGCPNGDPIAMDVRDQVGSIWYIGHETMYCTPLREIAAKVAEDLESFVVGLIEEEGFPYDYYDACSK